MKKKTVSDITKSVAEPNAQPDKETGPCCSWEFSCHCDEDKEEKKPVSQKGEVK